MESLTAFQRAVLAAFLGVCLVGAAPSGPVQQSDSTTGVWIAARTDGHNGKGTLNDPYDGSTSGRFDAVMAQIPPGATIHLLEGTFLTHGIVPKSGWRLYLTSKTTLRLDVLAWIPGQKWSILGSGSRLPISNIWIEGGVWDCSLQNQTIPMAAQAISFITSDGNVTIKGLKVINWGSTLPNAECFAVGVFNVGSTRSIARNVVFDGVEVTQPAAVIQRGTSTLIGAHGQDPANPKAVSSGWLENVEIKNCYVHDIDSPLTIGGVGMGSWCRSVHIHDNRFENLGPKSNTLFGCYLDTGASEDLVIQNNLFSGVVHGVWAIVGTPHPVGKWVIRNNRFLINRDGLSGAIELRGVQTTIRNVVVEGNTIESSTGKPLAANGILFRAVSDATIRDNIVNDIKSSNQIVFEKDVADCRLLNNRDRNGAVITPRRTFF